MKKITLENLIYKNYLKTSLFSIIFIELVLIIIYFIVNNNMIEKSVNFLLDDLKKNTYALVNEKTNTFNKKLDDVEALLKNLKNEQENFFSNKSGLTPKEKIKFEYAQNGMYYKVEDNSGSSVVVSKETFIDEDLKKELQESEVFDPIFKTIVNHDDEFVAAYFNSYKNYNRYYPFIENVYNIFPSNINMKDYNFYYRADEINNPKKEIVWTEVYLDPAKQGWLISAIAPIYDIKNKFQGVSGIDIKLDNFLKSFLEMKLPYDGKSLILNNQGKILIIQEELEKVFRSKNDNKYEYKHGEKIYRTVYKDEEINLSDEKFKEFNTLTKNLISKEKYNHQIKIDDKEYLIFTKKIDRTNWIIVSLIKKEKVLEKVSKLEKDYRLIGFGMIVVIIVSYLIFFVFLNIKAKEFVNTIDKPLQDIIDFSKNLLLDNDVKHIKYSGISELDKLTRNFNELSHQLHIRTKKLIDEESNRIYQEKLANSDALTNCYNRRYLYSFANEYIKTVKREKINLSVMMLDVDDFKIINDKYGHDMGDKVLVDFAKLIKENIRENDLLVRFGGDEFIVLLLNTKIEDANIVAQKILNNLNKYNSHKIFEVKSSIGLSSFENDDKIDTIISRADKALYEAKSLGKNCII